MKFDRVNTLVYASQWPIIDCLLAPSPRVKQKSKLLKNLQRSQVSYFHPLIYHSLYYLLNSLDLICSTFNMKCIMQESVGEALKVKVF